MVIGGCIKILEIHKMLPITTRILNIYVNMSYHFLIKPKLYTLTPNGPVRLQRFSQRMPTYEKLMQNVGIR